jgi:hypothetical protein
MPRDRTSRWIWRTSFYNDGCTTGTVRTVALRRAIFKQKEGFGTISLCIPYYSVVLFHTPSLGTVPLRPLKLARKKDCLIFNPAFYVRSGMKKCPDPGWKNVWIRDKKSRIRNTVATCMPLYHTGTLFRVIECTRNNKLFLFSDGSLYQPYCSEIQSR